MIGNTKKHISTNMLYFKEALSHIYSCKFSKDDIPSFVYIVFVL